MREAENEGGKSRRGRGGGGRGNFGNRVQGGSDQTVGSRILGMEVIIEVEVGVEATMRMEIRTISRKGMLWRVGHHLMEEEAAHMDEAAVFLLERNILPLDGVSMTVEVELDAGKLFVLVD